MINELQELAYKYILDKYKIINEKDIIETFNTEFGRVFDKKKYNVEIKDINNLENDIFKFAMNIEIVMKYKVNNQIQNESHLVDNIEKNETKLPILKRTNLSEIEFSLAFKKFKASTTYLLNKYKNKEK